MRLVGLCCFDSYTIDDSPTSGDCRNQNPNWTLEGMPLRRRADHLVLDQRADISNRIEVCGIRWLEGSQKWARGHAAGVRAEEPFRITTCL